MPDPLPIQAKHEVKLQCGVDRALSYPASGAQLISFRASVPRTGTSSSGADHAAVGD